MREKFVTILVKEELHLVLVQDLTLLGHSLHTRVHHLVPVKEAQYFEVFHVGACFTQRLLQLHASLRVEAPTMLLESLALHQLIRLFFLLPFRVLLVIASIVDFCDLAELICLLYAK